MGRLLLIFLLVTSCLNASSYDVPSPTLPNIDMGVSATVAECVNVITGDFVDSSNDLVVVGPEPLVFERTYASSDWRTTKMLSGWRYNHFNFVDAGGCIFSNDKEGKFITLHDPLNVNVHFSGKNYESLKQKKCLSGWTNCSAGIISARTNPFNVNVSHHKDPKYIKADMPTGALRYYHEKDAYKFKGIYQLTFEAKPNKHRLCYEYNKDGQCKKIRLADWVGHETFSWLDLHWGSNHVRLFSSDGREVVYGITEKGGAPYIKTVQRSDAPFISYEYKNRKGDEGAHICEKRWPENRTLEIRYFEGKSDEKGEDKLVRTDRVRSLYAPVGTDASLQKIFGFVYFGAFNEKTKKIERGATDVFDFHGIKTTYRYDEESRLTSIEKFKRDNSLHSKERFLWHGAQHEGFLHAKIIEDGSGKVQFARALDYDDIGNVLCETVYGSISGKGTPFSWQEKEKAEQYHKHYHYVPDRYHLMQQVVHDNGYEEVYRYIPETDLLIKKMIAVKNCGVIKRFGYDYDGHGVLTKIIEDDGVHEGFDRLERVKYRKITYIHPRKQMAYGVPELVEEKYLDLSTNQEILIIKKCNTFCRLGRLIKQEVYDANNTLRYTLRWDYDPHGNVIRETNALGEVTERSYDINNNLLFEKGPGFRYGKYYAYDYSNRRIREEEVLANGSRLVTSHTYDGTGNKIVTTDPFGQTVHYTYDEFGHMTSMTCPAIPNEQGQLVSTQVQYEYNALGQMTLFKDQRGSVTQTEYNIYGKPTRIVYPDGSSEQFTYSLDGNLISTIARNGTETKQTFDYLGRVVEKKIYSSQGELLSTSKNNYDSFHLISSIDPEGEITYYHYDGARRLSKIEKGDVCTEYAYDSLGRLSSVKEWYSQNGYKLTIKEYDLLDRVIEERIEENGEVLFITTLQYDGDGNVIRKTVGDQTTLTEYDGRKQVTKITDPEGNVSLVHYNYKAINPYGQTVQEVITVDPLGNQTVTTYNAQQKKGRICKKNSLGTNLSQQDLFYSGIGDLQYQIETVFTQDSTYTVTTHWIHDASHNLLELVEAEGSPEQKHSYFEYSCGQKTAQIKADGVRIQYIYDGLGRLSNTSSSDNSFSYAYTYNGNSQIIRIDDLISNTSTLRSYTSNRLTSETLQNGLNIQYEYDRLSRPTRVQFPDGTEALFTYNALHLTEISRLGHIYTYLEYATSGELLSAQLPGQLGQLQYTYNNNGQATSINTSHLTQTLTYDPAGNLIQSIQDGIEKNYTYNDMYQLTSEKDHNYEYDSLYNCTKKDGTARTFNKLNQLINRDYLYDNNGNLIQKGDTQYVYDALDRLIKVLTPEKEVSYTYDALHRRLSKRIVTAESDITEYFFYQGQNEVGSTDSQGNILNLRILGVGKGAEIGATLSIELSGQTYVPLHDHNGSILMLLSLSGEVIERYSYTAFGEEQEGPYLNPWRFSSKRTDGETGFVYFGRRYYDPKDCRWITPDPAGYIDGYNLYAYVKNNPLTHIDLYGLWTQAQNKAPLHSFFNVLSSYNYLGALKEIFYFPGRVLSVIGRYLLPLPWVGDVLCLCGHFVEKGPHTAYTPLYHKDKSKNFVAATAPTHDEVACIYTNGMDTDKQTCDKNAMVISDACGLPCYTTHNDTLTPVADLVEIGKQKFGFETRSVNKLVENINAQLQRVSDLVYIFAHSQGGLITYRALQQIDPSFRNRIVVYTFGTAKIIYGKELGLKMAQNFISTRDPIPIISDPWGFTKALLRNDGTITMSDSLGGIVDHSFLGPTYQNLLYRTGVSIRNKHNLL